MVLFQIDLKPAFNFDFNLLFMICKNFVGEKTVCCPHTKLVEAVAPTSATTESCMQYKKYVNVINPCLFIVWGFLVHYTVYT